MQTAWGASKRVLERVIGDHLSTAKPDVRILEENPLESYLDFTFVVVNRGALRKRNGVCSRDDA